MPAMLPVPTDGAPRLTAVLGAALDSLAGSPNPLDLPRADFTCPLSGRRPISTIW